MTTQNDRNRSRNSLEMVSDVPFGHSGQFRSFGAFCGHHHHHTCIILAFLQSINTAACPRGFRVVGQNCTANYPSPPPHHNHQHQLHSFTIIIFIFSFHRSDYDFLPGRLLISFLKVQHKRLMPSSWIYHYMVVQRTRY